MKAALDIAIGLVFVYLLYSLLVSILSEILAAWLDMRARMLRKAIGNMLNDFDPEKSKSFKAGLGEYFLIKNKKMEFTKAGKFYNHPSIKYLAVDRNRWNHATKIGKPAYIKKSTFCSVLLDMLREHSRGITDWDRIKFAIETNVAHFEPETANHLKTLLNDSDDSMNQFIIRVEAWYEEMMDRVNGWYKRKVGLMLTMIGAVLVLAFNVDTLEIIKKLTVDHETRKEMVQLAVGFEKNYKVAHDTVLDRNDSIRWDKLVARKDQLMIEVEKSNEVLGTGWDFTSLIQKQSIDRKICDKDTNDVKSINTNARIIQKQLVELRKRQFAKDGYVIDSLNKEMKTIADRAVKYFGDSTRIKKWFDKGQRIISVDSIVVIKAPKGQTNYFWFGDLRPTWRAQTGHIISCLHPFKVKLWGLFITVLALSLGAPFWFDLLRKLINIKNVGFNTDEKKKKSEDEKELTLRLVGGKKGKEMGTELLTGDAVEVVMARKRKEWMAIPGVIAVNSSVNSQGENIVEIVHDIDEDQERIKKFN